MPEGGVEAHIYILIIDKYTLSAAEKQLLDTAIAGNTTMGVNKKNRKQASMPASGQEI